VKAGKKKGFLGFSGKKKTKDTGGATTSSSSSDEEGIKKPKVKEPKEAPQSEFKEQEPKDSDEKKGFGISLDVKAEASIDVTASPSKRDDLSSSQSFEGNGSETKSPKSPSKKGTKKKGRPVKVEEKKGVLLKQGKDIFGRVWNKRYVVLYADGTVHYWSSQEEQEKGVEPQIIPVKESKIILGHTKQREDVIMLKNGSGKSETSWLLSHDDKEYLGEWLNAFSEVRRQYTGDRKPSRRVLAASPKEEVPAKDYVSSKQTGSNVGLTIDPTFVETTESKPEKETDAQT